MKTVGATPEFSVNSGSWGSGTLPQIHAALGYYYEYKKDVDLLPERSRETAEGLRRRVEDLSLMQLAKAETSATVSD